MDNSVDISSIRVSYNNDNQITLIDPIDTSIEFRKMVWQPFMKDFYISLIERTTEKCEKGLCKAALHSVIT